MTFATPTTQSQMYLVLKDIFYYYRIRREGFAGVELEDLQLERLSYAPLTTSELLSKAQALNSAKHYEFRANYLQGLNEELAVVNAKLANLEQNKTAKEDKIQADFNESVDKLNVALAKNGLSGSSIAVDKLAQLEIEKNKLLAGVEEDYLSQTTSLNAELEILNQKLEGAEEYCDEIITRENQAKQKELKDEQDKTVRDVFKYNNGLDEKEKRYSNTNKETIASLQIRFLEIRSGEYTKDQLVEMGYYEDVIDCVCAYYDTLPTLTAAQQILRDRKIVEYLDDYYESVVYMYQQRALE